MWNGTHSTTLNVTVQRSVIDIHPILDNVSLHRVRVENAESLTSTSFLLRVSLAFISIGVNPASLAQRCALVVFPIPGGPVMRTALKTFVPCLPGFLKPDFKLEGLEESLIRLS